MAKPKSYIRAGFTATAPTMTEAREAVEEQITHALQADYAPIFIMARGVVFIGWREPAGWQYGRASETPGQGWNEGPGQVRPICCGMRGERNEVERSMRAHLAQYVSTLDDSEPPEGTIRDAKDAQEFRDYQARARTTARGAA